LYTGWPYKVLAIRLTNIPSSGHNHCHNDLFKFWEVIDNFSEMVQDEDTVTTED